MFSDVVISVGGHWGYDLIKNLDIKIVEPKPSLVGLKTKEKCFLRKGILLVSSMEISKYTAENSVYEIQLKKTSRLLMQLCKYSRHSERAAF